MSDLARLRCWLAFSFLMVLLFCPAVQAQPASDETTPAEQATQPTATAAVDGDADTEAETPDLAAQVEQAALAGHNAWMLTSTALVLFMTAPGLALFYGGLVRKKNVLSVMMQCLFLMGLMTVLWAVYGYSLAFGGNDAGDNPWIGNGEYLFMQNVQRSWPEGGELIEPMFNEGSPTQIPLLTHMLFQGMFFIITPALICGAFAERMKFSSMVVFVVLWGTVVYCPLCHWVWDGGILAFDTASYMEPGATSSSWAGGALDFAGGTVVHISSGISALICALVLGKRIGWGHDDMRPHNLTYTAMGAAMLWVGWFGFNAGSELASDHLTSSAFAVTHFSAAAGALTWAFYEWISRGKPSVLGTASGAVAGLVCITPAAGFVNPMPALLMGALGGLVCAYACGTLKNKLGYDDSLDAFGVHGVGGTLGAILTGVFATRACWDITEAGKPLGLIEHGEIMTGQIVAVVVTWVYSIVVTYVLLRLVDLVMGLRVDEKAERAGLDVSQHEEEGYILF